MPTKTKKVQRKTMQINQAALLKHLKVIQTHGLVEQGTEKAVQIGREIFFWKKGTDEWPLSPSEVSQQINKI